MKKFKTLLVTVSLAAAGAVGPAAASSAHEMDHSKMGHSAMTTADMSDGEVRKIDKDQGKLTLRHGPIKNLDMPGMTMVFRVADKAMLDTVQPGDKIKFKAARQEGQIVVVELERAP